MVALTIGELLEWTAEERAKWLPWFKQNPTALSVAVQPGGRFPTVASLIDHIFLVEVRHTSRLRKTELPTATGIAIGDVDALWAYAAKGREGVRALLQTLSEKDAAVPFEVVIPAASPSGAGGKHSMTPRKLLFHMGLHEVRHWAQIAAVVRMAGFTPPGDHDLFYSKALL